MDKFIAFLLSFPISFINIFIRAATTRAIYTWFILPSFPNATIPFVVFFGGFMALLVIKGLPGYAHREVLNRKSEENPIGFQIEVLINNALWCGMVLFIAWLTKGIF